MLKLMKYLRPREIICILGVLLFSGAQVFLELKLPDYMSEITNLVMTPGTSGSQIWEAGGMMMLCAFAGLILSIAVGFLAAMTSSGFGARLREMVFKKVCGFSMEEISSFSTASLITRSTNDVIQIQMFLVMGVVILFRSVLMSVLAIIKISNKNWQWTFSTGVAVVLLITLICILMFFALPRFKKIQSLTDNLNRVTRENLTGLRVVRAYNAQAFQAEKFEEANDQLTRTQLFVQRAMSIMFPYMNIIMNGLGLAVYWIGAYLIDAAGGMDKIALFSDMIVFSSYAMQVVMSFMMLSMIFIILPRAGVSANRINEVLNKSSSIQDGPRTDDKMEKTDTKEGSDEDRKESKTEEETGKRQSAETTGEIVFDHVSFKYPDAGDYVLSDLSFTAQKGETVAFIGATGSGKTTIVNLALRFYDVTKGNIYVDGMDVRDYTLKELHNKFGYVSQRSVLFSGTIRSNVAYGENGQQTEFTDEEIWDALKIAQAEDFVKEKEAGLDTHVAQGGTNFSGGQKQRLSIARAICRKPEMLVFDDSFSALDYKTDRIVRKQLKEAFKDTTMLLVAQRIGTIIDADRIVVLDEGHVAGIGTHKELLKNCEVYKEIAYSQLSEEELA